MRADPGLDPVFFRFRICPNDQGAAGVILGDLGHELGIFLERTGRFAVNRQIDKRRARRGAFAFGPKFLELCADLGDLNRRAKRNSFSGGRHGLIPLANYLTAS